MACCIDWTGCLYRPSYVDVGVAEVIDTQCKTRTAKRYGTAGAKHVIRERWSIVACVPWGSGTVVCEVQVVAVMVNGHHGFARPHDQHIAQHKQPHDKCQNITCVRFYHADVT